MKLTKPSKILTEHRPAALQLAEIQSRLLDVGSAVATPKDTTKSKFKLERAVFDATAVLKVEVPTHRPLPLICLSTGSNKRCNVGLFYFSNNNAFHAITPSTP
jgi:hypothetical protein